MSVSAPRSLSIQQRSSGDGTSVAMDDAIECVEAAARRRFGKGDAQAGEMLAKTGGIEKHDRRGECWLRHRDEFAAALR